MILSLRFDVSGPDYGLDVSAHVKVAFDVDAQWIAGRDEVFQNDVDDVLVEDFYVAKGVDVELQAFQLNTGFVWNVLDSNDGEIRKVGERADSRELRYLEIDFDFVAGKLVRKSLEREEVHLRARC